MLSELSDETFDEIIGAADRPVLVDLWAQSCAHCHRLLPVLEELALEHGAAMVFTKLDTEAHPGIPRRFDVMGLPTLLVFQDGELVKRLVGAKGKRQLLEELADLL